MILPKSRPRVLLCRLRLWPRPIHRQRVQIVRWDSGSRYVLLSYTSGEAIDYVRPDKNVDQGAPINFEPRIWYGVSGYAFCRYER